jgi:hypothetical protein
MMKEEEGETGAKEEIQPLLADMEEQQQGDDKGKNKGNANNEPMTVDRLKVKLLAMALYLRHELSTMDADKAKHLGLQAKEKALAISLALKALMMQYYQELAALDKDKAKELGLKYQNKAKETASKYKHKAVGVAQELRTMDRDEAKDRSIQMIGKAKSGYGNMSTITKIKYGVLLVIVFQFSRSSSPGAKYGKLRKHPHLCYIHDEKTQGEDKVKQCEDMLAPVTKGYNKWLMIGNEPMFALFAPFHPLKEGPDAIFNKVKADRNMRRKNRFYFRYPSANQTEWESKYKDQASPTEIAESFENSECTSCPMNLIKATKKDLQIEILIDESSRDVHLPTKDTDTTQETVLKYIKENYSDREKTACVMQQSTYEMIKAPWRTTEDYLKYTNEFHRELENRCGIFIRIGLFHTNYDLRAKIEEWDHGTRDIVLDNSRNGFFIDVSNVRAPSPQGYITPVWEMLTRLMGGLQ